jgi:non-ribosomal peptide synthetase component E (peptide arylation enzyme)
MAASRMPDERKAEWRGLGLWQDISLAEAIARTAAERPHAPLHFFGAAGEQVTTLGAVHAEGRRLAGSFHALGLPGDTIGAIAQLHENAVLFQAAALLGCTLLPIVHIYGPHELAHILAEAVPRR